MILAMTYTMAAGALVLLAAAGVAAHLRRHGQPERAVWMIALVLSLLLPFGMMTRPGSPPRTDAVAPASTYAQQASAEPVYEAPIESGLQRGPADGLDGEVAMLWLLGSLALMVRWAVSAVRLARLAGTMRPGRLDGVDVSFTGDFGPAVTGVLRPRIVMPSWVVGLPVEQRRLVVRHEVEHLRAYDPLLIALGRLARVLTPWNPVIWMLHSRLAQAVELDCDRRVLVRYPDVASYGSTLLAISGGHRGLAAAAAFAESNVPLRRRILAMTTPPTKLRPWRSLGVVSIGAALILGAARLPAPRMQLSLDAPVRALSARLRVPQEATLPPPRVIDPPLPGLVPPVGDSVPLTITTRDGQVFTARVPDLDSLTNAIDGPLLIQWDRKFGWPARKAEDVTRGPSILNPNEVIAATAAAYPARLRERGVSGTVGVQFQVSRTGEVERVHIGQVSMYPDFDQAALEVAKTYRFSPAEIDGDPVRVWVVHPVIFRIE